MSKIAAGRAGWSANTFSEGGFGGQGLPDAQFTSTPALSITLELLYTTDSGWGEFSWGEGGWGHDERLTRTRSNWGVASATGSLIADFEASDAVQFTTTSASLLGDGQLQASVSFGFTLDPEADASMGAPPINMTTTVSAELTGHGDVAADLTSQLSFVTTATALGAAGIETSFSFAVANAELTATGDVEAALTGELPFTANVTAFLECNATESFSFSSVADPSLVLEEISESVQFVATPGLDAFGDVEVSKTTQFAVADATLLGHGDIGVELPHVFTFAADADRITEAEFSDTVTFTFSASGDAMKDAEASTSSTFTVGEAEVLGMTDMDADPITASFTISADLDGLGDVEFSDTVQFTTSSTPTGFADCEVSLESQLPFTVTVSGFGDVTFSETLTFGVSLARLGQIFHPAAGQELDLITIMKGDYNDEIVVFKPDYNDSITIVMPDYQSEQTILDVDVAA